MCTKYIISVGSFIHLLFDDNETA